MAFWLEILLIAGRLQATVFLLLKVRLPISVVVCRVTFIIVCETCAQPTFVQPASTQAGELEETRETCSVASCDRLNAMAAAPRF